LIAIKISGVINNRRFSLTRGEGAIKIWEVSGDTTFWIGVIVNLYHETHIQFIYLV